ncbi:MAG: lytic transglycosylase domain-containing protein [Zetaproteobacteria bacterium]|nr:lytic transglycosylase domain-containing protein [Zetaproteobacteria bacterium]
MAIRRRVFLLFWLVTVSSSLWQAELVYGFDPSELVKLMKDLPAHRFKKPSHYNMLSAEEQTLFELAQFLSKGYHRKSAYLASKLQDMRADDFGPAFYFYLATNACLQKNGVLCLSYVRQLDQVPQWREYRAVERVQLQLESYLLSKDVRRFLKYWQKVWRQKGLRQHLKVYAWRAALYYEKQSQWSKMFDLLEFLVADFPVTKNSRQSYLKLMYYAQKKNASSGRYYMSTRAIQNLSRNASISPVVEEIIARTIKQEIRIGSKSPSYLGLQEKIDLLIECRLYALAFELGVKREKENEFPSWRPTQRSHFYQSMGIISNRLYRYPTARKYFSLALQDQPKHQQKVALLESLADSFRYQGLRQRANTLYFDIAKRSNHRLSNWHYFWNAYLTRDKQTLESLFKQPLHRVLPPRDRLQPEGSVYWQARVYERWGKKDLATDLYKKVLNEYEDDIYSYFVAQNGFADTRQPVGTKLNPVWQKAWTKFARGLEGSTEHWVGRNKTLKMVSKYLRVGLVVDAQALLETIDLFTLSSRELLWVAKIAQQADAHRILYRVTKRFVLKLHKSGQNWYTLQASRKLLPELWKWYYPRPLQKIIYDAADSFGMDPLLVYSVMRNESRYQEKALSHVGARGLMQLMPYTVIKIKRLAKMKELELDSVWKADVNALVGTWYLAYLMRHFNHTTVLAVAAYNAGPKAVHSWLRRCKNCRLDEFIDSISYRETRQYVKRVLRDLQRYRSIYKPKVKTESFAQKIPVIPENSQLF